MRRIHRKSGMGPLLLVLLFSMSCAEKPDKKVASGEDEGLYLKTKLTGMTHNVAKIDKKLSLLFEKIDRSALESVSFTISKSYLTMFAGEDTSDSSKAIYQFEIIDHWDLLPEKNKDGTSSQYLVRNKTTNKDWQVRPYIEIDPYDPKKIKVNDFGGTNSHSVVIKKSEIDGQCWKGKTTPIEDVNDILRNKGVALSDTGQICFEINQTILSVYSKNSVRTLLLTFDIENHLDVDLQDHERESNALKNEKAKIWSERAYVQINLKNPRFAESVVGENVLSRSVLDGEYVYVATVVASHSENPYFFEGQTFVGGDRLEFKQSANFLTGYKVHETLNNSAAKSPALRYHASFFDIMRRRNEYGDATNITEENQDKPWNSRSQMRVEFARNEISGFYNDILGYAREELKVHDSRQVGEIEIDQSYLSFDTEEVIELLSGELVALTIKHAFVRVDNRDYQAKEYSQADFNRFGFFWTTEYGLSDDLQPTDATLKHFIGRHDISSGKKIIFYLSPNYPDRYKNETTLMIKTWNSAFAKATGRPDIIELRENSGQKIGDPRFNMIVWIDTRIAAGLAGYGPSVADPVTGEFISSRTFIFEDAFRYYKKYVSDYHDIVNGKVPSDFENETATLIEQIHRGKAEGEKGLFEIEMNQFASRLPTSKKGFEEAVKTATGLPTDLSRVIVNRSNRMPVKMTNLLQSDTSRALLDAIDLKKQVLTDKKLSSYESNRIQGCFYDSDQHIISATSFVRANQNLSKEDLIKKFISHHVFGTLIHEVGHNLGLRHNFHGSFDERNFSRRYFELKKMQENGEELPEGEYPELYRSSSVMDYNDGFEALSLDVGLYDVAAIKYGYASKVEKIVDVDSQTGIFITEDINVNDVEANTPIKSYKFCTDGHVWSDPTCNRFDRGTTVSEIAQSIADDYDSTYALTAFRRGRRDFSGSATKVFSRSILPLRQFLDELLYKFVRGEFGGQSTSGAVRPENFADYWRATNIALNFYLKILNTVEPGHYHFDETTEEFTPGFSTDENAKNLVVPLGPQAKYLTSTFAQGGEWEGDERQVRRGVEFDKMAVMFALSMRGFPATKYERASLAVNFYDIAGELTLDILSNFMRDEYRSNFAAIKNQEGIFVPVGDNQELSEEQPEKILGKIKGSTSLLLKLYAMVYASANFDSNSNKTYKDYIDFRIKGVNDRGDEPLIFESASGIRTYAISQTVDGRSISYAIAENAPQMSSDLLLARSQIMTLKPQLEVKLGSAFAAFLPSFLKIWQLAMGEDLDVDTVAQIKSAPDQYLDTMLQIIDGFRASGNPDLSSLIEGEESIYKGLLDDYRTVAAQVAMATESTRDLERKLLAIESALLQIQEIYEIFN